MSSPITYADTFADGIATRTPPALTFSAPNIDQDMLRRALDPRSVKVPLEVGRA